jgi:DNA-binding NtrC family response regulator/Tfp pilus assembly protein PilF
MNQDITQILSLLDKADESIRNGFYNRALKELDCIEIVYLDKIGAGQYYLLLSAANFSIGNYSEENIDRAIEFLRNTDANDLYAESKFIKAQLAIAKGKHDSAKELLIESYAGYLRAKNMGGAAKILNRLSFVSMIAGDIESAIENLLKSIEGYKQLRDNDRVLALNMNLALIYFISGTIRKSMRIYENIQDEFQQLKEEYRYHFDLNFGLCLAHGGFMDKAQDEMHKTTIFPEFYKREKAQYYEFLGWIHNLDGNFKEAEKALKSGLELSLKIAPESALISQTKRLLADTYLGLKKYDLAQEFAEEALVVAEKINERAEIAACYRVFAQVCLRNGENDKAKEWFKKAIDLFAMIKSRYELAVTRYLVAISGLYHNGERSALLYLAKEYFESEEIAPYIEKVDKALASSVIPKPILKPSGNGAPVFIAESSKTKKILEKAEHFSPTDYTVLITGPTGVGKDQLAKYIHWASDRKGAYLSFNCAAFPETMIEAELFGYSKGAYTGADCHKRGLIELAENGTLCLNEIAETPVNFQAKLLDFLETKIIRPIGSTQFKKVDVRIIAVTNQDLEACMATGGFRSDLFYRLKQIEVYLPALSERIEDIPELVKHFLKGKGFDISQNGNQKEFEYLCSVLSNRDWPGNVRELEYEIGTQYFLSGNDLIRLADLIEVPSLSEREILIKTLEQTGWNQREAARRLGVDEGTIRYRIKRYQLAQD